MNTYFIEIFNHKTGIYVSYRIVAEVKREALLRAVRDQVEITRASRYQVQILGAKVDI